jgi:DNA-binding CsgD family transcriptional regulator
MTDHDGWSNLTRRQRQVAELTGEGLTVIEIAERLMVSTNNVKQHLWRVYRILGIAGRNKRGQLIHRMHAMDDRLARLEAAARQAGWDV